MENNLFRKQSLDHISSPEELHNYMRVTGPRLWMLLSAILVLLVGFLLFAGTTTLENTMSIKVKVESYEYTEGRKVNGEIPKLTTVTAELPLSTLNSLEVGMPFRLGDEKGVIDYFGASKDDKKVYVLFDMEHDYLPIPDAEYDAEIVLESSAPITYLFK